jgi:hypothetical protein
MPRKLFSYNRFIGLDTVTSPSNMSERFLFQLENAYVDFRGQIVKGPTIEKPVVSTNGLSTYKLYPILQIAHYGDDDFVAYYFRVTTGGVIHAASYKDLVIQTNMFDADTSLTPPKVITPISIVNFDQKQFAFMAGHDPYYYNGTAFTNAATGANNQYNTNLSYPQGGMAVNILNRLVVAGIPGKETEIHISAQDSFEDWRTNTSSGGTTPNQTDGAIIDVKNQFTSKDTIQGLAVLEGDKLVVFGKNETLVYLADTNINLWEIARDFRVPIGLFGRNTAVNVGTDVFFCSRFGIHSLKRAASGLTLETKTFTREVEDLYQQMVRLTPSFTDQYRNYGSTANLALHGQPFHEPHAVWDGSIGQYHVFFPQLEFNVYDPNQSYTARLTMTYDPEAGRSGHLSFSYRKSDGLDWDSFHQDDKAEFCASYFAVPEEVRTGTLNGSNLQRPFTGPVLVGTHTGWGKFVLNYVDSTSYSPGTGINHQQYPYSTVIRTPLLSQGSPDTYKHYKRLIIRAVSNNSDLSNLRAGGSSSPASMDVTIFDSENNQLQLISSVVVENDGMETTVLNPNSSFIPPTSIRPIDIPIPHRAKSISIQFSTNTNHELKILDFALVVDTK